MGRDENAKPPDRVPLVTTYHPSTKTLVREINKEWQHLSHDKSLPATFSNHPINAQRQPKNLKNLLAKSSISKTQKKKGNSPCGKSRCQTFAHMLTSEKIELTNTFSVSTPHATCDSKNVIYCISCTRCPNAIYIGETGTKFRLRYNNHRNSIKHKSSLPVAEHFNSANHSLDDLRFCIIGTDFKEREVRRLAEMKFIIQTRSFETGLNIETSDGLAISPSTT